MPRRQFRSFIRLCAATAIGLALSVGLSSAQAQERELKVGYMKNPIQDASLDIMEKWAKDHGVKLTRVPMAYSVFMEKVTTTLTTGTDQFDVIWHNDDWGQLWKKWLDTTDDIKGIENADRWPLLAFWTEEKKLTVVPMAHTVGTFFYRSDLVKPEEVPKTFDQLVSVSQRLQREGKVKWGYVGGMSMNNTWFSFWWTMWANNCDILKPLFERDNDKLVAAKFEPAVTEPCHREIVEFWWDAINTHKIIPPGMTAYGRNEANAIFMAGQAALTPVDSTPFRGGAGGAHSIFAHGDRRTRGHARGHPEGVGRTYRQDPPRRHRELARAEWNRCAGQVRSAPSPACGGGLGRG